MISTKIKNDKKSSSKFGRVHGLANYITTPELENGREKCIYADAENFLTSTLDAQKMEMIALSQEGVKSKDPIDHWMLSWHHDEHPTPQQAKQAVALFIDHCGLTGHQYLWGLHDDTKNRHVHIVVNRVNPDTLKVVKINKGFDKEASQQAIALIEHAQGWRKEENSRYNIENGKPVLSEKGALAKSYGKPLAPGSTAKAKEIQTGEKSAERIGIEDAAPIIRNAASWKQLHTGLAAIGMRYERDGSGAKVYVGDIGIKASDVDRKASFGQLQKRLGVYQPAKEIPPNDYHHHTPQPHPAAAGENARHGLLNLSECRLAHLEKGQQASRAGVLHVDARADRSGSGGLRRAAGPGNSSPRLTPQPLRPDQPGWKEYITIRDMQKAAKNQDITVLQQRHSAERTALLAKLKAERDAVLAGNWKGRGDLRNAMQSVLATQQAAEKLALAEQQRAERKALQARYKPLPMYKQWKEQPLIVGEAVQSLADQRITRDQQPPKLSAILQALTHTVDLRLHVTYQLNGKNMFRDEGRTIRVLDVTSDAGIAAALATAQQKYGNSLTLTGAMAFQHKAVAVAVANNLTCRFTDPALEALRARLTAEKYQTARTARAAEIHAEAQRALVKEKVTQPGNIDRTPAVGPSMLHQPAQRACAPTAQMPAVPPQPVPPTEEEQDQIFARARLAAEAVMIDARAALTAELQGQGKEVRKITDSMLYSGKIITITEDGRFAVQKVDRNAVVIHDLAQLDGSYASGQGADIQYREGRGQDKLQGRQRKGSALGR